MFVHAPADRPSGLVGGDLGFGVVSDETMFRICGLMLLTMGLVWAYQALVRGHALTIEARGLTGFTLFGTKFIAWPDVSWIELNWHPQLKSMLTIHAKMGSETGGYLLTGIPVTIGRVDRSQEEILAAVRAHRPDVDVIEKGRRNRLVELWLKIMSLAHR